MIKLEKEINEIRDKFPMDDVDAGWFALAELCLLLGYLANEYYKRHEHNTKLDFSKQGLGTDTSWSGGFEHSTYALAIGPNGDKMSAILSAGYEMKDKPGRAELVNALNALEKAKKVCEGKIKILEPAIEKLEEEI